MADDEPYPALGFVIDNLKEIIQCNADLHGWLSKNTSKLSHDLDLMKGFFKTYTEVRKDFFSLEKRADDARNVVHQAEDAIEEYILLDTENMSNRMMEIEKQIEQVSVQVANFFPEKACIRSEPPEALKIVESTNKEKKKKKALVVEADNVIGFEDVAEKALVVEADNVIGFEDEAEKVIKLLKGGSKNLEIVSIIGMLGLGKTTLSKKVFHDPVVAYNFHYRAFINVSHEYTRREVFINILSDLNLMTPEITVMPVNKIRKLLRKNLEKNKYLIVMDDVLDPSVWGILKDAFPNKNNGSRILITSRYGKVALHVNPSKNPHYLRYMTGDESRELLRKKVFGENKCPPELQRYELRILVKCDGLALAIVLVAGALLSNKESQDLWEKVSGSVNDYVTRDQSHINDVIYICFNHLPYHLQTCFLYLGVFCEDFEIPTWVLLRLWIAEGFIERNGDMTLEDIADDYLEELVDRNLVLVGKRGLNGKIKTCRIHDILRDFCKKEASKQKLFKEIKKVEPLSASSSHSYRRICINSNVYNYVTSEPSEKGVRSFLTFSKEEINIPSTHISLIPKTFTFLRVLDVRSIRLRHFPSELYSLYFLKYFAISGNLESIPEKLSKLKYLQTIIIHTTYGILDIKADIQKWPFLRHLITNASLHLLLTNAASSSLQKGKFPIEANENLQTLSTISVESCTTQVFERSPCLKKLGIFGKLTTVIQASGESTLFEELVKLEFLENLKLLNDDITSRLFVLPRETNFPRNLKRLTLKNTLLDWSQMSILGKLQKLEVLKLKDNAFHGELWQTEDGGFGCLKGLHIGSTNLVMWKSKYSHFPLLTCLHLRHCSRLEAIPHSFVNILTLGTIDLYCCNRRVADSARRMQTLKLQQLLQQNHGKTSQINLAVYPPDH